jgi:hypothetical protein
MAANTSSPLLKRSGISGTSSAAHQMIGDGSKLKKPGEPH